jgi:hypothetical protein
MTLAFDYTADGGFCESITEHGWPAPPVPAYITEAVRRVELGEILEPAGVEHPTPDLMSILTRKEPLMLTAPTERLALPAGAPVPIEPDVRAAIAAAADLEPATPPPATAVVHVTTNALLAKIADDIDAEVARLLAAKARLLAVVA